MWFGCSAATVRPASTDGNPPEWPNNQALASGFASDYDWRPVWREIAAGLAEGAGAAPVCLYHPQGGDWTTSQMLPDERWLSINGMQSGHGGGHDQPVWDLVTRDYALEPGQAHLGSGAKLRGPSLQSLAALGSGDRILPGLRCPQAVLALRARRRLRRDLRPPRRLAAGGDRFDVINHADRDWRDALNRPGGNQVRFLRDLLESRPFFRRVPDQTLIASDAGKGGDHIRAARDRDGTYAFVYIPRNDQRVTVNLAALPAKTLRAWWYDPRNGISRLLGEIPAVASEFTTHPTVPTGCWSSTIRQRATRRLASSRWRPEPAHLVSPHSIVLNMNLRCLLIPMLACSAAARLLAGNPLISTVYSADPSAHVWPGDDRLWLYCSHDQPGTNTHDTMISYHVFSSSDLVNWTDYGVVLHLKDVHWAISHMWAIDCVLWKGTYYLVFCAKEKGTGIFRTGLATSPRPQGPFTDIGYIQGMEWGQDPALFVDDDGVPYLYWGAGGVCHGARLSDDLRSVVPGTIVDLTKQLTYVYEGPWVHKYRGKYYLSYPGLPGGNWPENMYYAIADKPLGPYVSRAATFRNSRDRLARITAPSSNTRAAGWRCTTACGSPADSARCAT
jgi:hypothetical protein